MVVGQSNLVCQENPALLLRSSERHNKKSILNSHQWEAYPGASWQPMRGCPWFCHDRPGCRAMQKLLHQMTSIRAGYQENRNKVEYWTFHKLIWSQTRGLWCPGDIVDRLPSKWRGQYHCYNLSLYFPFWWPYFFPKRTIPRLFNICVITMKCVGP